MSYNAQEHLVQNMGFVLNHFILKGIFFISFLIFASTACVTDIKYRRIPDWTTFLGIGILSVLRLFLLKDTPVIILAELFYGVILFLGIRILTGGKLGMGDVKFAALMGLFNGFPQWFTAVAIASFSGLLFMLAGMAIGKLNRNSRIPFAPFLTAGSIGAFITAPELLKTVGRYMH